MPESGSRIGGNHVGYSGGQIGFEGLSTPTIGQSGQYSVQAHPNVQLQMPTISAGGDVQSKSIEASDWKIEKNISEDNLGIHEKIFLCVELTEEEEQAFKNMTPGQRKQLLAEFKQYMRGKEWNAAVRHGVPLSQQSGEGSFSANVPGVNVGASGTGAGLKGGIDGPGLNLQTPNINGKLPGFNLGGSGAGSNGDIDGSGVNLQAPNIKGNLPGFDVNTGNQKSRFQRFKDKFRRKPKQINPFELDAIGAKLRGGGKLSRSERKLLEGLDDAGRLKFQQDHGISPRQFELGRKGKVAIPDLSLIANKLKLGGKLSRSERKTLEGLDDAERLKFQQNYDISSRQLSLGLKGKAATPDHLIAEKLRKGSRLSSDERAYIAGLSESERLAFQKQYGITSDQFELGLKGRGARVKGAFGRFGRKLHNFFVAKPVSKFVKWGSKYGVKNFSRWDEKNQNNLFEASAYLSGLKRDGEIIEGDLNPVQSGHAQMLMANSGHQVADIARNNPHLMAGDPELNAELDGQFPLIDIEGKGGAGDADISPQANAGAGNVGVNPGGISLGGPQVDLNGGVSPQANVGGGNFGVNPGNISLDGPQVDLDSPATEVVFKDRLKESKLNPKNWGFGKNKGAVDISSGNITASTPGLRGANSGGNVNFNAPQVGVDMPQVLPSHALHFVKTETVTVDTTAKGSASTAALYKYLVSQSLDAGYTPEQQFQHEQMVQQALIMEGLAHEEGNSIVLDGFDRGKAAMVCGWVNLASESPELATFHYKSIYEHNENMRRRQQQV